MLISLESNSSVIVIPNVNNNILIPDVILLFLINVLNNIIIVDINTNEMLVIKKLLTFFTSTFNIMWISNVYINNSKVKIIIVNNFDI